MWTRQEYMRDRLCTFEDYYGSIIKDSGYKMKLTPECRKALKEEYGGGNVNFNPFPDTLVNPENKLFCSLSFWDYVLPVCPQSVARELRKRGDYPTQDGLVCIAKESARIQIKEV